MILRWYFSLHFQRSLICDKALCIKDISLILYRKMRLWYFFREKIFIRAYDCWFFIAWELLSKFHYSLIPFVGRIMLRRRPPFLHSSPSHNFFRNFFAKSFVDSIIFVTFAVSYLAESSIWAKAGWTYIHKGVTVRFGFDVSESRKFNLSVKNKATGTPHGVYHIYNPY